MFQKRVCCIALVVLLALIFAGQALAATSIEQQALNKVNDGIVLYLDSPVALVNGTKTVIDNTNLEVCPFEKNGRTLVPIRFISESLGAKVDWNIDTLTATVSLKDKTVKLEVGGKEIIVNNSASTLDVPAEIVQGRTFIPLRALVESLDKKVFYDSGLIIISDQDNIIDNDSERELIDELILLCTGTGNRVSNLISGGSYAQHDKWVIYSNAADKGCLYKREINGTQNSKLSNDIAVSINVLGNWVYYLVPSGSRTDYWEDSEYEVTLYDIYKIKADGSQRTKISKEKSLRSMAVVGNWIYYINSDNHLFKMKVDGSGQVIICNDIVSEFRLAVYNDWIYYDLDPFKNEINYDEEFYGLYRIKTDGTGKAGVTTDVVSSFDIAGDWIYFDSFKGLSKMKLDGSEATVILNENCLPDYINVVGDWIFFRENQDKGRLYRVKVDGTEKARLNDDDTWRVSVIGDWIFYERYHIENGILPDYKIRFDGSNRTKIS